MQSLFCTVVGKILIFACHSNSDNEHENALLLESLFFFSIIYRDLKPDNVGFGKNMYYIIFHHFMIVFTFVLMDIITDL